MVMVHIRPKRFPKGTYKKLHSKNAGPYKIVKKISSNAYVLELPSNMGFSNVFNVEDLTMYLGHSDHEDKDQAVVHLPLAPHTKEDVDDVLDDQIVLTRGGGYQKYLVKWKNRPLSKCTWNTAKEFQHINCDLYESYHSSFSLVLRISKSGRDDGERKWELTLNL